MSTLTSPHRSSIDVGARLAESIHWQRHKIRFNAMAAVLTALAWIGFSYFVWFSTTPDHSHPNRTGEDFNFVAYISGVYEHQWADEMRPMAPNSSMAAGERLQLADGIIEITFFDGAVVTLEAPAEFVVESSGTGTLNLGKLVATVPQEAIGFTVTTPTGRIVDLGTQFGLLVNEAGDAEVHVFDGQVDAILCDGSGSEIRRVRLTKDQAARLTADESSFEFAAVDIDWFQFHHTIQGARAARLAGLVAHYEFEGDLTDSTGNGHDGTFVGNASIIDDPQRGNVYQNALASYVDIDSTIPIPSLPNYCGVTLTAWVNRNDVNLSSNGQFASAVSLGRGGNYPVMTLAVCNDGSVAGFIEGDGADKQCYAEGPAGAVTNGVWTHIAVTFDRVNNVARLYINGAQTGSDVSIPDVGDGLLDWTHADVGGLESFSEPRIFPGMIDDVRIYYAVLPESDLQSLYDESSIAPFDVGADISQQLELGPDGTLHQFSSRVACPHPRVGHTDRSHP